MTGNAIYSLPDLPYETDDLELVLSKRIMDLHHGTHHAGYVKAANSLTDERSGRRHFVEIVDWEGVGGPRNALAQIST
jgi:superoxide dismutase, Fe-Mn family